MCRGKREVGKGKSEGNGKREKTYPFSLLPYPLILVCAAILLLTGCANDEPPVDVTTEKVSPCDGKVSYSGTTALSDAVPVQPPISGNVVAIYFADGQDVIEGQRLLKIGDKAKETELIQSQAAVGEARAAVARATSELRQAELLLKRNAVSAQEVSDKRFALEERQAQLEQRQAQTNALEQQTATGIVTAPVSGRVSANVTLSAAVKPETVLATIGNFNPIAVRFDISPEEKIFLAANVLKVSLKFSDGKIYPHAGKLQIEDNFAEALFDNADGSLSTGEAVQVEVEGLKLPGALLISPEAVYNRDGENFVYVVDSNKAELKKISVGGKLGTHFIVKDGLRAGDSVVIESLTNLREGQPVNVRN